VSTTDPVQSRTAAQGARRRRVSGRAAGAGPAPFEQVLELHGPALLRFCAAQAGPDRAEDVFQETMLSALRSYEQVRDAASIRSWLFSIAARKAIDAYRVHARSPRPSSDLERSAIAEDIAFVDGGIWAHVRRLPEKQRQAVTLRFLGDLTHSEIAEVMHTSEAAARRNVFEGLSTLRARLDPDARERRERP
jgi:RNA polymerase sigma factor (sigma-70 family)